MKPSYFDQDYFDGGKGYHTYNDDGRFQHMANEIAELKPKSVLDFGCAKGFLVKALRDRNIEAYGYDVSDYATEGALWCTTKRTQVPKVDVVYSMDTFEHIPEEELDGIKKWLKSIGKRFYFTVGTLSTPDWQHDASHITMHDLQWWEDWWTDAEWKESK